MFHDSCNAGFVLLKKEIIEKSVCRSVRKESVVPLEMGDLFWVPGVFSLMRRQLTPQQLFRFGKTEKRLTRLPMRISPNLRENW